MGTNKQTDGQIFTQYSGISSHSHEGVRINLDTIWHLERYSTSYRPWQWQETCLLPKWLHLSHQPHPPSIPSPTHFINLTFSWDLLHHCSLGVHVQNLGTAKGRIWSCTQISHPFVALKLAINSACHRPCYLVGYFSDVVYGIPMQD